MSSWGLVNELLKCDMSPCMSDRLIVQLEVQKSLVQGQGRQATRKMMMLRRHQKAMPRTSRWLVHISWDMQLKSRSRLRHVGIAA